MTSDSLQNEASEVQTENLTRRFPLIFTSLASLWRTLILDVNETAPDPYNRAFGKPVYTIQFLYIGLKIKTTVMLDFVQRILLFLFR